MADPAATPTRTPTRAPAAGDALEAALGPVRLALLAAAGAEADRLRDEAATRSMRMLADARAQVDSLLARERARGAEESATALTMVRARARRKARAAVLRARREAYETLRARGLQSLARLQEEPAYGLTRDRLADAARRMLGPDAVVEDAVGGGVIGRVPGRRLDYSLAAFAAPAIDELAVELFEAMT